MSNDHYMECRAIANDNWTTIDHNLQPDFYAASTYKQLVFAGKIEDYKYTSAGLQYGDQTRYHKANMQIFDALVGPLDHRNGWVYVKPTSRLYKYKDCCQTFKARNNPIAGSAACFGVFGRTDTVHVGD